MCKLAERKGGTRKIADFPEEKICRSREHNPAMMIVREPGYYEHTCPSCGHVQHFTVPPKPSLSIDKGVSIKKVNKQPDLSFLNGYLPNNYAGGIG